MRGMSHPHGDDGLKRSACTTKPGTQRVPGGLKQPAQAGFVYSAWVRIGGCLRRQLYLRPQAARG